MVSNFHLNIFPIRDLARTSPACLLDLLDRQFHENFLFGQAKISMNIFNFDFLGVITKYFTNKPSSRT